MARCGPEHCNLEGCVTSNTVTTQPLQLEYLLLALHELNNVSIDHRPVKVLI